MKKRYFYMSDINSTSTVIESTKKELLSIALMFKEEAAFNFSNDDTISGYTKSGKFFYYDCTNFWDLKKSDIINAISIVYSNESDTEVYGAYYINECGVVGPSDDGQTTISCNLKEVDREDYREDQTDEELIEAVENLCTRIDESIKEADQMIEETENMIKEQAAALQEARAKDFEEQKSEETADLKKQFDVFYTNQSTPNLAIYNHKPDRWRFDIPPVLAMETENALYFCPAYYNIDDVVKFLRRNAARAANK